MQSERDVRDGQCLKKRTLLRQVVQRAGYIPHYVKEKVFLPFFYPLFGKKKWGYLYTGLAERKGVFNTDNSANPMKRKQLALITALFCPYMEPLFYVSRGKTREDDTGKRDYRHRARTGCVEKRSVAHGCFCAPHMQGRKSTGSPMPRSW
jgi:hypothetical protein